MGMARMGWGWTAGSVEQAFTVSFPHLPGLNTLHGDAWTISTNQLEATKGKRKNIPIAQGDPQPAPNKSFGSVALELVRIGLPVTSIIEVTFAK